MSQTKYVKFANSGFYVYDVALGVFLKHLIDAAEASDQVKAAWLSSAVQSWREAACIPDWGLSLDPSWSAEQRQTFLALANEACARLARRTSIPSEEIVGWRILDGLPIFPRGVTEVLTSPLVELGHALVALVSGELPQAPEGKAWLYGTPSGREMLGVMRTR